MLDEAGVKLSVRWHTASLAHSVLCKVETIWQGLLRGWQSEDF